MLPERSGRAAIVGACIAIGLAAAAGLSGCSKFDAALGQQWATVDFKANTPEATVFQVRDGCSHIPNVHPEAIPRRENPDTAQYDLTFQTNNASDANLAQLQQCLQRYPSVAGIDFEDSGDEGG
jgi:hypothetical protein